MYFLNSYFILLDVTVAAFKSFSLYCSAQNRGVWLETGVTQR